MSVAYYCVLAAALSPYVTVGIAKATGRYDNSNPRAPESYNGLSRRAHGAHQNGFEAFPFFAIAVLIASGASAKATIPLLDMFAVAWIAIRVAYIVAYLSNWASLRSLIWSAGVIVTVVIFTMPAWHA